MNKLGDRFDQFVEAQVKSGAFRSADDVLRAGLELLEQHQQKANALEHTLLEGEASADFQQIDWESFLSGEELSTRPLR